MENINNNQYKPQLDILKFILALLIISIHTNALKDFSPFLNDLFCQGVARLAVPLFFIMSGYFLYKKEETINILKKYCSRLLKLYLFYFILFFPIIIYLRYFNCGSNYPVIWFISCILFGSSFEGSWYINASILAPIIIFWKKNNKHMLMVLSISLYVFCTLYARYNLIYFIPFNDLIVQILPNLANTVLIAIPYFVLAKYIANTEKKDLFMWKYKYFGLIICLILLLFEIIFCHFYFNGGSDCYFLLLPTAYFIFIILNNLNLKINNGKSLFLRKLSTLIYIWHFIVIHLLAYISKIIFQFEINRIIFYFLVATITIIISFIIIKLSEKIRILKYAY